MSSFFGMGVAVADYDNDRWPDIFITAVGGNRLYRNRDGKRFEDVTSAAGIGGPSGLPEVSGGGVSFDRGADLIPVLGDLARLRRRWPARPLRLQLPELVSRR